jgi:ornithine carbamoyltransferase
MIIDSATSQLSRGEPINDTAHVLERMVDLIVWRTYSQNAMEQMAVNSAKPVINALTDTFHPCQVLADLAALAQIGDLQNLLPNGFVDPDSEYSKLSAAEKVARLSGKTVAYFGDGANNMAHSYLLGCANAGLNVRIVAPKEFWPSRTVVDDAKVLAKANDVEVLLTDNLEEGMTGADLITTDAWLSMGMDSSEVEVRAKAFYKYQINSCNIKLANKNALFMHCLPAYREKEVSTNVFDGPQSAVFEEAEFRKYAQKALICKLLELSS